MSNRWDLNSLPSAPSPRQVRVLIDGEFAQNVAGCETLSSVVLRLGRERGISSAAVYGDDGEQIDASEGSKTLDELELEEIDMRKKDARAIAPGVWQIR